MIKRYRQVGDELLSLVRDENGEWMRSEDHLVALKAEREMTQKQADIIIQLLDVIARALIQNLEGTARDDCSELRGHAMQRHYDRNSE